MATTGEEPGSNEALVPAPVSHAPPEPAFPVRAWAEPLLRFDRAWARLEVKIATVVLVAEIAALVAWVVLKGLATEYQPASGNRAGLVLRAVLGALVLGGGVFAGLKGRVPEDRRKMATSVAVIVGLAAAKLWPSGGAAYFANVLNWLQGASTLTLVGGLRAVATRLTLWVALLGGAIATSQGKHINVDVVMRFLGARARVTVAAIGWIAASVVCTTAVWGFVDDIAIGHFLAPARGPCPPGVAQAGGCDTGAKEKLSHMTHEMSADLFLLGRQISLDFKMMGRVLTGQSYSETLKAKEWNDWLRGTDWTSHFKADDVKQLELPETEPQPTRLPIIAIPGSPENVPGLLVRDFDLIVPFGLLVLAIRFLIRAVLGFTGHVRVDPDAAHGDEDVEAAQAKLHAQTADAAKEAS